MLVGIDFGISNTDIGILKNDQYNFFTAKTSGEDLTIDLVKKILKDKNISLSKIDLIGVTGGKSSNLKSSVDGIKIIKINEIDAIGLGAKKLYGINNKPALIISAGTGTACVKTEHNCFDHMGGIAVGGGMLEGMGSLLFNNDKGEEINEFASKGSKEKLDMLIGDVVNEIGNLSPHITAVNFGKAKSASADTIENTSAALCNMVGEVIGTIAYLNAYLIGSDKVYFIGRTSYLSEVLKGINQRLELAGIEGQYYDNREYGNVVGVLEGIKNSQ